MCDRLDDAEVDGECVADQLLAVARDRRTGDLQLRIGRIELLQIVAHERHGVARVWRIKRAEQVARAVAEHELDRGRPGVDAQKHLVLRRVQLPNALGSSLVPPPKGLIFRAVCKKRRLVAALRVIRTQLERGLQGFKRQLRARPRARRAERDEIKRVLRAGARGFQHIVEAFAQLGKEIQRPAQIEHPAGDPSALRQTGDGLVHNGIKDPGGNVLVARALIEQRLHIRLCKHAAAGGDRADLLALGGQIVQLRRRDVQQRGHLVDERARTPGAGAVHAHLEATGEEEDLRILTAQLDDHVGVRRGALHGKLFGIDLLHKGQSGLFGDAHAGRAGDRHGERLIREFFAQLTDQLRRRLGDAREMAAIYGILDRVVLAQNDTFERRRADVKP